MPVSLAWWLRERAVRIGQLWVPGREVDNSLAKYTKQLFCLTIRNIHTASWDQQRVSGTAATTSCFGVAILNLESQFFGIRDEELWPGTEDAPLFVFSFPTRLCRDEYDPPHVHVTQVVTGGRYDGRSNAVHLRVELGRTQHFSVDGLSGAPVYHLSKDAQGFFMGLAGITVRGGGDFVYFIDARFLVT